MTEVIRVSHSAITKNNQCPRKAFFENIRLFPEYGSIAMRYGSGFHKGMECYYRNNKDLLKGIEGAAEFWQKPTIQQFHEDYRNLQSLINSISLYHDQYRNDEEEVFGSPEEKIYIIIELTDEEKQIYGDFKVEFISILDLMLKLDGMKWIVDFKTTSVNLDYMAAKLRKLIQLMGYQFSAREHYEGINGTLVYYHQLKATKSRKTGEYGSVTTDFRKFPQIFSERDYQYWRKYIIWNAFKIKKAQDSDYPAEYGSCFDFNSTCEYMPLCDHPRWDIDSFKEMNGFCIVPDDRRKVLLQTSSLPLSERRYHIL